jgi:LuxR family transcriptional regulator/LuxR family quorum-sensing system transcriptional regulator CciR
MQETGIFREIDRADNPSHLLTTLSEFYAAYGFEAVCYVLPSLSQPGQYQLFERGMPGEWMNRYLAMDFGLVDPIPEYVIRTGEVDTLRHVLQKTTVTETQRAYLDEFYRSGVTNGLGMPTHGRKHTRGFFGITQVSDEDLAAADRSLMHAVAQHAHSQFEHLGMETGKDIYRLSPRECEILKWVAAGKSNPDIATILGISLPTVATHLKRAFAKLEVHDRVSAAMMAHRLGMV